MADQRRWFKVWTSIISDDDFDPTRSGGLIGVGRFAMLGAYTALHGSKGVLKIMPDTLLRLTNTTKIDELRAELALKNVSFEESENRYGKITVTWAKWQQYQEDSTAKYRMRTLRSKRRGEEIRREETRNTESLRDSSDRQKPGASEWPSDWLWLKTFVQEQKLCALPVNRFMEFDWWDKLSYSCGGLDKPFLETELAKMGRWLMENPRRVPTPTGFRRFVATWLERAHEKERRFKIAK